MPSFTLLSTLMVLALHLSPTLAWWRMGCGSRLVLERMDPIVAPGTVGGHVHTIHGGNAFGPNTTFTDARNAACSTCEVSQDMSNYWVPQLYFRAQNGSLVEVPLSGTYAGLQGGITVYYLIRPNPVNEKVHAFPADFRMIAGHYRRRKYTGTYAAQAIQFQCLDYTGAQGGSIQTNYLPTNPCPNGIRAQVFFPQCWNGSIDSLDHHSHMAYPASQAYNSGPCPASHPLRTPALFYEVIFESDQFTSDWWVPEGAKQPFVFAQGDPTGYGLHGDFLNGWDVEKLQEAIDTCTDPNGVIENCPVFEPTLRTPAEMQECHIPPQVNEDVTGPMSQLPGCNPIQNGPNLARFTYENCPANEVKIVSGPQGYTDLTKTLKWKYVGCGTDNIDDRTFTGASGYNATTETVEKCVEFCSAAGFTYAGMEWSTQCYCDNTLRADRAPVPGVLGSCTMPCSGNKSQMCGGNGALSIYEKCGSGSCTNAQFKPSRKTRRDLRLRRGTT